MSRAEEVRLRAMIDRLLPIAELYVSAFGDDEKMTLPERLRLQEIEDIVSDPNGWTTDREVGS
jgi:hypothetical protein